MSFLSKLLRRRRPGGSSAPHEVFGVYARSGRCLHMHHGDSASFVDGGQAAWGAMWNNRADLGDVAHTHPHGPDTFSSIDESSMSAIATGLGRSVRFWVLSPRWTVLRVVHPGGRSESDVRYEPGADNEPCWAARLRWESRMRTAPAPSDLPKVVRRLISR